MLGKRSQVHGAVSNGVRWKPSVYGFLGHGFSATPAWYLTTARGGDLPSRICGKTLVLHRSMLWPDVSLGRPMSWRVAAFKGVPPEGLFPDPEPIPGTNEPGQCRKAVLTWARHDAHRSIRPGQGHSRAPDCGTSS